MSSRSVTSSVDTPLSYSPDISRAASTTGTPTGSPSGSRIGRPNVFPADDHEASAARESPPLKDRVKEKMPEKVEATAKKIIPLFSLAKSAYFLATFRLAKARPHFADAKQGFVRDANRFFSFLKSFFTKSPKVSKEASPKEDAPKGSRESVDGSQHSVQSEDTFEKLDESLETHKLHGKYTFKGRLNNGIPVGFGRLSDGDTESITGNFVNGRLVGEYRLNKEGKVTTYFASGEDCIFVGSVKEGRPYTGKGRVEMDGCLHDGSFVKGKLFDGTKFLKDGNPDGYFLYEKGEETFVTPEYKFKGELKDGAPFKGVVTRAIYERINNYETVEQGHHSVNVVEGVEEESGIMKYTHDKIFKGKLNSDYLPHGEGEMIESGISQKGNYVNGVPLGKFVVTRNGQVYDYFYSQHRGSHFFVGTIGENNAPDTGEGSIYHDGIFYTGKFVKGKFVDGRFERESAENPGNFDIIGVKNSEETLIGIITPEYRFEGTFENGVPFNGKLIRECDYGTLTLKLVNGKETTGTLSYLYYNKMFTGTFDQYGNPMHGRGFVPLPDGTTYEGEYDSMCKGRGVRTYQYGSTTYHYVSTIEANWINKTFMPGEMIYTYEDGNELHMTCLKAGEMPTIASFVFKNENDEIETSEVKLDSKARIVQSKKAVLDLEKGHFIGKIEGGQPVDGILTYKAYNAVFRGSFEGGRPKTGTLTMDDTKIELICGKNPDGDTPDFL